MTARVPDVPCSSQAIVNAALTKEIEVRYQSAEEMRVDLVDFGRGRPLTFAYEPACTMTCPVDAAPPTVAAAVAQQVIPAPSGPRRRNWGGIIAAIVGLGLLGVVVVYLLVNTGSSDEKADPDGRGPERRRPAASTRPPPPSPPPGFTVSRLDDELSSQAPGTVISQDPDGRAPRRRRARPITLTVARHRGHDPRRRRPDLRRGGSASLQRLQLVVARNNVDSADKAPGTVLASNPAASDQGAEGLDGHARRRRRARRSTCPTCVGKSQAEAHDILRFVEPPTDRRHRSRPTPSRRATPSPPTPAAGTRVPRGSPIRLVVSSGPAEVDVPNVIGQPTQTGDGDPVQRGVQRRRAADDRAARGHRVRPEPDRRQAAPGSRRSRSSSASDARPVARRPSLRTWYARHGRHDLPWRRTRDRWLVLTSEVMLHQTQVARAEVAWPEFVARFPTPEAMAAAGPAAVIRAWGRLGYPRRARHLYDAAVADRARRLARRPAHPPRRRPVHRRRRSWPRPTTSTSLRST